MSSVFISYRRYDAPELTERIFHCLADQFGEDAIFMDRDDILPGANFHDVLARYLATCCVMVVIIGPEWMMAGSDGRPRIYDPRDFVGIEVSAGLKRDILVVPVFVGGVTRPPSIEQLPEQLSTLAELSGIQFRDGDFNACVDSLLGVIVPVMAQHEKAIRADELIDIDPFDWRNDRIKPLKHGPFPSIKAKMNYDNLRFQFRGELRSLGSFQGVESTFTQATVPFNKFSRFHIQPNIKKKVSDRVRAACQCSDNEHLYAAIDFSLFQTASSGLVVSGATVTTFAKSGVEYSVPLHVFGRGLIQLHGSSLIVIGPIEIRVPWPVNRSHVAEFLKIVGQTLGQMPKGAVVI